MRVREIGVGLIGVGWMGRLHSVAMQRVGTHFPDLPLRPRLVLASDTVAERAHAAARELGYRDASEDWREVVSHPEVELVSITVPNHLHREMGVAAASAGRHIWIEKPVGRSAGDAAAVEAEARRAGVVTAVGYNYRHAPAVQHARELVATGRLGRITHVRGVFLNDHAAEPDAPLSWRFRREYAGSGAAGDLLSHAIDLLQYLVGPISRVVAQTDTFVAERPVPPGGGPPHVSVGAAGGRAPVENEDYIGALIRFASGARGVVEASRATVGPRCQLAFDIFGSDGAVSWDFERMNELRVCIGRSGPAHGYATVRAGPGHGEYAAFQPGPAIAMGYDDLKVIEAALLLRSIAAGREFGPNIQDGLSTARVLDAMFRSAENGRWEPVDTGGRS